MEPRPYIRHDASFVVDTPAGKLEIKPLERDRVRVDSAHSNSVPWNDELHETKGLTIRGVVWSVTGFVYKLGPDKWTADAPGPESSDAFAVQISHRGGIGGATPAALRKAREIVADAVTAWAADHAHELAAADHAWRNNQARGAEEQIIRAQKYLRELRAIVRANDRGETRSEYSHGFEVLHEER